VDPAVVLSIRQQLFAGLIYFLLTYDVVCRYWVNFQRRIEAFLLPPQQYSLIKLSMYIPKWHLGGHNEACADRFSLNYALNVGRMSGELVETPWAYLNGFQYSTQEMGHGPRREVLTTAFNHWNWQKTS
jgi:hypothetical protein